MVFGRRTLIHRLALAVASRSQPGEPVVVLIPYRTGYRDRRAHARLLAAAARYGVSVADAREGHRRGVLAVSGRWDAVSRYVHHWAWMTGEP